MDIISFIGGVVSGLIANYLLPPFRRIVEAMFSQLFYVLNPDKYDLTGKWKQTFTEPSAHDPSQWEEVTEIAEFRHIGNKITGTGETQDDHRQFVYDCKIQHNLVFGTYVKKAQKGNITGNGMIQLIISPDRLKMDGQATWFDHDTNQIESSKCRWEKM